MANSIALLIPALIGTIQDVARSSGGLINAVSFDATAEAAAIGQSVPLPELPDIVANDVTPSGSVPAAADTTATGPTLTLTKHKDAAFALTAEENRALGVRGAEFRSVQMTAAIAVLIDTVCADINSTLDVSAGLALGTAGTNPFASDPNILMDGWESLTNTKAPGFGRRAILHTNHYAAAGKLSEFRKFSEAQPGTSFARAELGMLANFQTGYDQNIGSHTAGTGASYLVNGALSAGATTIVVDTGTGTILAGDVVSFAGDTANQYVVKTALAGGQFVLNEGLKVAIADNAAITVRATHKVSHLVHPMAVAYAARPSAELPDGDLATMKQVVRDPVTGLAVRLAYYPGFHQGQWRASIVYGGVARRSRWIRKVIG